MLLTFTSMSSSFIKFIPDVIVLEKSSSSVERSGGI